MRRDRLPSVLGPFFHARPGKHVGQAVVPLVAGVLEHRAVAAGQRQRSAPGSCPCVRIGDCEFVIDRVLVHALETLDDVQRLAEVGVEVPDEGVFIKICLFDDERLSLPPA